MRARTMFQYFFCNSHDGYIYLCHHNHHGIIATLQWERAKKNGKCLKNYISYDSAKRTTLLCDAVWENVCANEFVYYSKPLAFGM